MNHKVFLVAVIFFGKPVFAQQAVPQLPLNVASLCSKGSEGSLGTLDACRLAVQKDPSNPYLLFVLGNVLHGVYGTDSLSISIKLWDRGVEMDPSNPQVRFLRAYGYMLEKKTAQAKKEAETALRLQPGFEPAIHLLTFLGQNRGMNTTLPASDSTVGTVQSIALEHIQRGKTLLRYGKNPEAALQEFRRAAGMLPLTNGEIYKDIGHALADLGHNAEAIAALDTALFRDSTLTTVYFEIARLYSLLKNKEGVEKTMRRAARAMPENEDIQKAVAAIDAIATGNPLPADNLDFSITTVEENTTPTPVQMISLANAHIAKDQPESAVRLIRALPRSLPDSAGAWGAVAAISAKAHYYKEAVAAWKRALEIDKKYFVGRSEEEKVFKKILPAIGNIPSATLKSLDEPLGTRGL